MIVIISLGVGILIYYSINWIITSLFSEKIRIQDRLAEFDTNIVEFDDRVIKGELSGRLFRPVIARIINFLALLIPMGEETSENLNSQLIQAGISLRAREYRASVLLFTLSLTLILIFYGFIAGLSTGMKILLGILGIYGGIVISRFYLQSKITSRKEKIYLQFPSVMDLLSVCVTAGLGFDQAVSYITKRMEGPIIEELKILLREISMGTPRNEALVRFARRCDLKEIDVFVSAVNQAEELGSPLANILESQAFSIRNAHKQKTEEKAQKISIKMILPMVLFILPVVFIVILGPIVPSVISGLGDF